MLAQSTLTGNVSDKTSELPLPGVNVIIKGTTNGTITDFDGNFTLSNLKSGDVIEFSYVGFKTLDVTFSNQRSIQISLEEDNAQLDEVVLIGYGTVKKRDATGSVTQISAEDFNKGANVTAENLLNGKVAGVTINTSGAPGSGSEIRIRGGSSLLASNDPLIVIDGLPIDNNGVAGATSILSSINPNDIESFSILKDASATAIYGSRASNGVIIINTKRGSKKLQVDYNFQYGSGRNVGEIDVFSADRYRDLVAGTFDENGNQLTPGVGTPAQVALLGDANTNWQKAIYRRTDFVDNNLSIKGNLFGAIPTRLSIGNTYQEGLRLTNEFTRNSVSLNLSPSFFENHLKLRISANYTNQRNRFADGVEGSAIRFDPTQPIYDENSPYDGFFEYYNPSLPGNPFLNPSTGNPVAQLLQTNDRGLNNRLFGNFEIDYKFHFLPELRAVVNFGYDNNDGERSRTRSTNARSGFQNNNISLGTKFSENNQRINKLLDFYFIYNKKFGNLDFEGTAGYSYQKFENSGQAGFEATDPTDERRYYVDTDVVLLGYFGRANFNLHDKYLLTLSYRRDGTSRFGPDNRWGNFPAAALGWKIKEDFFKDSTVLSDLKLRVGWGITGQQSIDNPSFYQSIYNLGDANSQYIIGGQPVNVGVPSAFGPLKWEETTTYNVGLDYGFYENRLNGSLDFFYKLSQDLFQIGPFADGSNFSNQGPQNVGDMSSKGVEFSINYDVFRSEDFNWNIGFNATKFERRIEKIALGSPLFTGQSGAGTGGTSQILQEGFTPFSFFVYKQLYDSTGAAIEGAFADLNGDGIINGDDRYIYKNPDPDLLLGFNSNLNYKNFDFAFNLRASIGNRVLNAVESTRSYYALIQNGVLENISTNVLNTNFVEQNGENVLSDMYVENASFLRMDYVTLGYTFPKWLDGNASLRLFTGVQNAFVITKYGGLDPEVTGGFDNTIYPRQRQFLFGANVKF
ncbi:SusC/RagA family TonB-linked outer membrane protein [Flavobacterium orientale]|uniref:SusC/RagA family TonB-linked outer membrane protein n=2 Tax=Flavobacterium orientale TaxID=1756020 RepID=A0A916XXD0_9FLAO|nr:SusC/RagA family TonB-linked outer membrane protein [Flavobacterium orientale]